MSMSEAALDEDELDWTRITQPRLRKRLQNQVSQRKHCELCLVPSLNATYSSHMLHSGQDDTPCVKYTVDTFAWAGKKIRQQLEIQPEPGQSSSAVPCVGNNNPIPPQPFFHTIEGQPLPLQGQPVGGEGYGEDTPTSDLANTWNEWSGPHRYHQPELY